MVHRIRALCKAKGLTQSALEDALGFGRGAIGKWDKHKPSYDRIRLVASFFGVDPDQITGEPSHDPFPPSDDDLKFALWGGAAKEITDEEFEEVKRFAAFIAERRKKQREGDGK